MKKQWWKWVCVVLLTYVTAGGLLVPLGPGISRIEPFTFTPDSLYSFTITGAKTHFTHPSTQLWFKANGKYFCADNIHAINAGTLSAVFRIPSNLKDSIQDNNFDVIINNDEDGTIALREGLVLTPKTSSDSTSLVPPIKACVVEVHQNKSAHFGFPFREILYQTIRNTFFHVPMWFCMLFLLLFSFVSSINYLSKGELKYDVYAAAGVVAALLFGVLGLLTGMMWATYTWGEPWPNDPKLNGAAVGVLIYFAYIVLRGSIADEIKRARIAAVYNVFAVVIFILFIFIIPRITDSLHPGNGGNPAFSKYDLDNSLRMFFYPAVIGWSLLGFWLCTLLIRIKFLTLKNEQ